MNQPTTEEIEKCAEEIYSIIFPKPNMWPVTTIAGTMRIAAIYHLTQTAALRQELEGARRALEASGGAGLIATERARQISKEGWTTERDDAHVLGELTEAACCYAVVAGAEIRGSCAAEWPVDMLSSQYGSGMHDWPWDGEWWKPSDDPVRNLVKAGALIAAEIDRLQRAQKALNPKTP